ncbi:Crp/Fnr family transcriptional regulator [Herbidospora daliensis]|uniref:Crp/Fnr family transcriptional regulator n=1 Tax=Herbidospora daliensis TaxID=295585 RepID=UPI000784BB9D|nr:Crp/Fnr family transcriptional regulator [Herbidospora daliensis]
MFGSVHRWPPASLLGSLPPALRTRLLSLGFEIGKDPDSVLMHEGEQTRHAFLLVSGYVRVTGTTEAGRVALLAIRGAGDLIGELAALDGRPRSATITAASSLIARVIRHDVLRTFMTGHPEAAVAISSAIGAKLRSATRSRIDLSGAPAQLRVARVLRELADTHGIPGPGDTVELALSQPDLAALTGTSKPRVEAVLRELRQEEILSTGYRRIVILDPARLAKRAQ